MPRSFSAIACVIAVVLPIAAKAEVIEPVIAIHGGSSSITRGTIDPNLDVRFRASLIEAAQAGQRALTSGGSAVDAVAAAIKVMEDDPLFNAGKGAVFTSAGEHELHAAIMDGSTRSAGAVAGLRRVKNPILAAKAVMENSRHVLLIADEADAFAGDQKLDLVPNSYFSTPHQLRALERAKGHDSTAPAEKKKSGLDLAADRKFGTVGAVVRDSQGRLAAGTSTGGLINKMPGRVGDSPIIGAGTYAENGVIAVSATGTGEMFIRSVGAYDIAARMKYGKTEAQQSAEASLARIEEIGGSGGFIAVDADGKVVFAFNTSAMYRAFAKGNAVPVAKIFSDE
jgi:beta-aspartyl-peptidase (threonine type)